VFDKMREAVQRGPQRGLRYLRVLAWMVREAFLRDFWGRPVRILVSAGLRMGCQAGAVTVLYFYANALKQGQSLTVGPIHMAARESILLMWLVILASFFMFGLTSLFQYFSRTTSLDLASDFEERSSRRALEILSRLPDPRTPAANEILQRGGGRKVLTDARRAGMTLRRIGYAVPQVISGIGATVSVFVIDYKLTLMLTGIMGLVLLGLYPVYVRGADHSRVFERKLAKAGKVLSGMLHSFLEPGHRSEEVARQLDELYVAGGYRQAIAAFKGRIRILEESTLVTQVGSAFVISSAVFIIGSRLLRGGMDWGALAAYVVSLRIALNGVVPVARLFASISRFYPQLSRYHEIFMAEPLLAAVPSPLKPGDVLVLGNTGVEARVAFPGLAALYTPDPINRGLLHIFSHAAVAFPEGGERAFTGRVRIVPAADGRENISAGDQDVLIVGLERAEALGAAGLRALSAGALVLVVYQDLEHPPRFGESLALFVADGRVEGAVDLQEGDFHEAASGVAEKFRTVKRGYLEDEEDEEEDDDF